MKADKMAFIKEYGDGSGVEFSVEFDGAEVEIHSHGEDCSIPSNQIEWVRDCLLEIKNNCTFKDEKATI